MLFSDITNLLYFPSGDNNEYYKNSRILAVGDVGLEVDEFTQLYLLYYGSQLIFTSQTNNVNLIFLDWDFWKRDAHYVVLITGETFVTNMTNTNIFIHV